MIVIGKITAELGITVDYLLGDSAVVADKRQIKRIEEIEALPKEEKAKIYYFGAGPSLTTKPKRLSHGK